MTPPIWLDENGATRPVRRCLRCGRAAPVYRFRVEHLRLIGWRLFAPVEYVNWCGHAQEFVALPKGDGWCPYSARRGEVSTPLAGTTSRPPDARAPRVRASPLRSAAARDDRLTGARRADAGASRSA